MITLKLKFTDFWADFNYTDNYFIRLLGSCFDLEISDYPDVLFYSFAGSENRKYMNCVRFFFSGENIRPDFRTTDYAISYDYVDSNRHFRWPLYNLYGLKIPSDLNNLERNKFCCMVVSNDQCTYRNIFFEELNKIKKVDSGGRYKNNIGGPVADKLEFLKRYKFCLAFENSSYPGYTTEKLLEAKKAGCIPVYWGNPLVSRDFNPDAFINIHDFKTWKEIFAYMEKLDSNDNLFLQMQSAPLLVHDAYTDEKKFVDWIASRIAQKTNREKVRIDLYKPTLDLPWVFSYLRYSFMDIVTRKIGIKRAFKSIKYKAYQ